MSVMFMVFSPLGQIFTVLEVTDSMGGSGLLMRGKGRDGTKRKNIAFFAQILFLFRVIHPIIEGEVLYFN